MLIISLQGCSRQLYVFSLNGQFNLVSFWISFVAFFLLSDATLNHYTLHLQFSFGVGGHNCLVILLHALAEAAVDGRLSLENSLNVTCYGDWGVRLLNCLGRKIAFPRFRMPSFSKTLKSGAVLLTHIVVSFYSSKFQSSCDFLVTQHTCYFMWCAEDILLLLKWLAFQYLKMITYTCWLILMMSSYTVEEWCISFLKLKSNTGCPSPIAYISDV